MDLRARDNLYFKIEISDDIDDYNPSIEKGCKISSAQQGIPPLSVLLKNLHQYVIKNWSSLMPVFIFGAVNGILLLLVFIFHNTVFSKLNDLGLYLKSLGAIGMVIPIFIITLASFPPIPGYGTMSVLCGFVYGFPYGFLPPFIGGVIGASGCFLASRKYGRFYIRRLLSHYKYIDAALKAIEIKGVRLLLLIRVAPYPWTVMNFVMGATSLSYFEYILATALSLPKLLLHVYIGSSVQSFTEKKGLTTANVIFALITFTLGVSATIYMYFLCKAVISDTLEEGTKNSDCDDEVINLGLDL